MTNMATPRCQFCTASVSSDYTPDHGMTSLVCDDENYLSTCTPVTVATSSGPLRCPKHSGHDTIGHCEPCDELVCGVCMLASHSGHSMSTESAMACAVVRQRCAEAAVTLSNGAERIIASIATIEAAKQRMVDRCTASVVKLECDATALKAAIDAHVAQTKAALKAELKVRLKALDGQLDGLSVSASQLSAGAALCNKLARQVDRTAGELLAGFTTVQNLSKLNVACTGPCVSTVCEVVTDTSPVVTALSAAFTRLRLAVDSSKSSVTGRGLQYLRDGFMNAIAVVVKDCDGNDVDTLSVQDVHVTVLGRRHDSLPNIPITATVSTALERGLNAFDVTYQLPSEARAVVDDVSITVNVCGNETIRAFPIIVKVMTTMTSCCASYVAIRA